MRRQTAEQEEAASRYLQLSLMSASAAAANGGSGTTSKPLSLSLPLAVWPPPATEPEPQNAMPAMGAMDILGSVVALQRTQHNQQSGTHSDLVPTDSSSTEDSERCSGPNEDDDIDKDDRQDLLAVLDSESEAQMEVETASPLGRLEALCARANCNGDKDGADDQ